MFLPVVWIPRRGAIGEERRGCGRVLCARGTGANTQSRKTQEGGVEVTAAPSSRFG